jgi:hypothetical protein
MQLKLAVMHSFVQFNILKIRIIENGHSSQFWSRTWRKEATVTEWWLTLFWIATLHHGIAAETSVAALLLFLIHVPTVVPKYRESRFTHTFMTRNAGVVIEYMPSADVEDPVRPDFVQYQQRSDRRIYAHGVLCVELEIISWSLLAKWQKQPVWSVSTTWKYTRYRASTGKSAEIGNWSLPQLLLFRGRDQYHRKICILQS